jgi:hypothetical protein
MNNGHPWRLADYHAFEVEEPDREVLVSLLVASLRLSVDSLGLAETANAVSAWLAAEADATIVQLEASDHATH